VARFRITGTTTEFLFMVNHLYRSRAARRHEQSQLLNAWARTQTLPIIALGDYNYDWSVQNGDTDHDAGYDLLTADGVFVWIRPATLRRTHCSHHNSVLDFVFAAGDARTWDGLAEILPADPSYCPDDNTTSDHRMVVAAFDLSAGNGGLRAQLLQRLTAIETELQEVRRMVEGMQ
jgi:endonuclease/exonuclease/phosphatase (EEP) superfamily protein YafD